MSTCLSDLNVLQSILSRTDTCPTHEHLNPSEQGTAILLSLSVLFTPSDLKYQIEYRLYLLVHSVSRPAVLNDCFKGYL